jgi:hypothetical protein
MSRPLASPNTRSAEDGRRHRRTLLPEEKRASAARYLAEDIERNRGLTTGFVGVRHLLPALSEAGRDDLAYRLLVSETFPSWGYSINTVPRPSGSAGRAGPRRRV